LADIKAGRVRNVKHVRADLQLNSDESRRRKLSELGAMLAEGIADADAGRTAPLEEVGGRASGQIPGNGQAQGMKVVFTLT
jgi:hypothetical protein